MLINKKKVNNFFYIFLTIHLILWTLIPSLTNNNLPLDTIEALAWGSNLDWGFNKHPPMSAFMVEIFYSIFGSNDWAYYFLSQIFLITAFIYVWKLSNEILDNKIYSLIAVLALEGFFFYNFTTPEFNVNISQLPFWALTVYYFWKSINLNKIFDWLLFGIFSALGFLSKYLFIYLLFAILIYFSIYCRKNKMLIKNYFISIIFSLLILTPHFFWLNENDYVSIFYGLKRSSLNEFNLIYHLINPLTLIIKQIIIFIPFLLMVLVTLKKLKFNLNFKNKKNSFIILMTLTPIILILITSILTGAKIRTMWMTPFYLFTGICFIQIVKKNIEIKKLKRFFILFSFFFFLSPMIYLSVSILDETKRTDYPGQEIARLVQNKWDKNFINDIKIVVGDEWAAGNLSYHLSSRPIWINDLKKKSSEIKSDQGVIYTGNPKILKNICPGVFGSIKPVGYCMIGKR